MGTRDIADGAATLSFIHEASGLYGIKYTLETSRIFASCLIYVYPVLVTNPDFDVTTVESFGSVVGLVSRSGAVIVTVAPDTEQVKPEQEQEAPVIVDCVI